MTALPQEKRRRFDLPPEAEKYLVWYGFMILLKNPPFILREPQDERGGD